MADGIRIPEQFSFRYPESSVDIVGNYNLNNGEAINLNEATFREYKPWECEEMRLLEGYDDYEDKFVGQEGHTALNELLKWIIGSNYKLDDNNINFVTTRGNLKTIAATLYQRGTIKKRAGNYSWEFRVCRYNGVIYISKDKKNKKLEKGYYLRCSYAGTVFAGSRVIKNDDMLGYVVAECRLKGIKCLIAGEPDCKD